MTLDLKSARKAVQKLAKQMERSVEEAAHGIIEVANVNIDRALRRVSIARGYDPRTFTLMAFGGAGPLHACAVAERLEIPRVLVPRYPGVLCAFGLLVADVLRDYSQTMLQTVTENTLADLRKRLEGMLAQARADLRGEGIASSAMTFMPSVDMRYVGQSFELNIPYGKNLVKAFHSAHEARYGHAFQERSAEIVTVRLQAVGSVEKPVIGAEPVQTQPAVPLQQKNGLTFYDREALLPGMTFAGPALVFQLDSTVYVAPGWVARVDAYRNLIFERNQTAE